MKIRKGESILRAKNSLEADWVWCFWNHSSLTGSDSDARLLGHTNQMADRIYLWICQWDGLLRSENTWWGEGVAPCSEALFWAVSFSLPWKPKEYLSTRYTHFFSKASRLCLSLCFAHCVNLFVFLLSFRSCKESILLTVIQPYPVSVLWAKVPLHVLELLVSSTHSRKATRMNNSRDKLPEFTMRA